MKNKFIIFSLCMAISIGAFTQTDTTMENTRSIYKSTMKSSEKRLSDMKLQKTTSTITRGAPPVEWGSTDPCEKDFWELIGMLDDAKAIHAKCCRGEGSTKEIYTVFKRLDYLSNNPNCTWGIGMYATLIYTMSSLKDFVCENKCDRAGCLQCKDFE